MMRLSFEDKVYQIVAKIPRGQVLTYKEIAKRSGSPRAVRAVGNAMAKNTRWPKIPCHRVICSDGRVGNWSGKGGKSRKISLLFEEGLKIQAGRIIQN